MTTASDIKDALHRRYGGAGTLRGKPDPWEYAKKFSVKDGTLHIDMTEGDPDD